MLYKTAKGTHIVPNDNAIDFTAHGGLRITVWNKQTHKNHVIEQPNHSLLKNGQHMPARSKECFL